MKFKTKKTLSPQPLRSGRMAPLRPISSESRVRRDERARNKSLYIVPLTLLIRSNLLVESFNGSAKSFQERFYLFQFVVRKISVTQLGVFRIPVEPEHILQRL